MATIAVFWLSPRVALDIKFSLIYYKRVAVRQPFFLH